MAQIRLKNFRKYESLDSLNLNTINIFVGKNNAGKSTVVKAIMLALDNIRSLRWKDVTSKEGMQSIQNFLNHYSVLMPMVFITFTSVHLSELNVIGLTIEGSSLPWNTTGLNSKLLLPVLWETVRFQCLLRN